jgi:3-polyprenyl-4-hydroxybenzoate decarboxylase
MAYRSFRQFLEALEQTGELNRITVPVDTDLVISEWANREMKSPGGGKVSSGDLMAAGWTLDRRRDDLCAG